jgi:5-(carboxyamino)imidazole ribonucleotide synthase
VLKTRRAGYDGRGQARASGFGELQEGWDALGRQPVVLESFVDFEREISVILARDAAGHVRFYPIAENVHRRHVLHSTRVPAAISHALARKAEGVGARIAAAFEYVGTMAVELFVTRSGELLVNEVAPRTHNSGHYTFGACATSQFEQHIRAICGLPLGDPSLLRPAVMLNLLGDLWADGLPDWSGVLAHPTARLHLYGKKVPSAGRKMGHILVVDEDAREVTAAADAILATLDKRGAPAEAGSWT